MIIYQNSRTGFLSDVDDNVLLDRLEKAFKVKTGSIPADKRVWADEYTRFSGALRTAKVSDEIQVAIEYHVSSIGRSRIDVILAGNDGKQDNGLIIELKAWDRAGLSDIENMVWLPLEASASSSTPACKPSSTRSKSSISIRTSRTTP